MDKNAPDDRDFFRVCYVCKRQQNWNEIVGAAETIAESKYKKPVCWDCYYDMPKEQRETYIDEEDTY